MFPAHGVSRGPQASLARKLRQQVRQRRTQSGQARIVRCAVATPIKREEKPTDLWGSGTILLVEDEDMVRAVAERALSRQGYTVLTAEHGEAALELLARCEKPDLLISDVVMPLMDGPTMVRHVRSRYPDLPILFMSGYAEEQLR
eukprot:gene57-91_t